MNRTTSRPIGRRRAFTLTELLVVIAIIGILAGLLLPALATAKVSAQKKRAALEIGGIVSAIKSFEQTYSIFPASRQVLDAAAKAQDDFTYGWPATAPNNAEVIAILMDATSYGNGQPTVNAGHVKNPQQHKFLSPQMSKDNQSPGVGLDGIYRDPWGSPYVISLDLNYDGKCRDAFYKLAAVSATSPYGLVRNPTSGLYECTSDVMVWSAGPDKQASPSLPANQGVNLDNILSWK